MRDMVVAVRHLPCGQFCAAASYDSRDLRSQGDALEFVGRKGPDFEIEHVTSAVGVKLDCECFR